MQVGRLQAPIEHALGAGPREPQAQVEVPVVAHREALRRHPDPLEVAPPGRHVAQPEATEHRQVTRLEAGTVLLVLAGVEPGRRRHAVFDVHGHVAQHHEVLPLLVTAGVTRGEAGAGDDVVVHQQDHVAGAVPDPLAEGAQLPAVLDQERAQGGDGIRQRAEPGVGSVNIAVENDDDLGDGGVTREGLDERAEQVTSIPRRSDHRHGRPGGRSAAPVSFIAWGAVSGRSREIAEALGGESHCIFPPESSWRPHASIRYVLATFDTAAYLVRHRPRSVLVTNPPVFAGLVALACARLFGATVVLDSHPGGFGAQGDTLSAKLQGLHRWLVRHVDGSAVASPQWVEVVREWGGAVVEVHEAPGPLVPSPRLRAQGSRLRVLCVGRLAPDEPADEIVRAASLLPDCDFLVTGDVARWPELVPGAPANVTFTGYLGPDAYAQAIQDADVILTLTTEPSSVMRAAYEAVYALRPLIVTDTPLNRNLFPHAVLVDNDAEGIAGGVRRLRDGWPDFAQAAPEARAVQLERWAHQRHQLQVLLGLAPHDEDEGSSTIFATPSPPPRARRDGVLARIRRSLQKVHVST